MTSRAGENFEEMPPNQRKPWTGESLWNLWKVCATYVFSNWVLQSKVPASAFTTEVVNLNEKFALKYMDASLERIPGITSGTT